MTDTEPAPKTNKPSDSAFKQQRLPAWQPILTAGTVLPTFFFIGIAFIPIGIGLLYFSDEVVEKVVDYTHCVMFNESTKSLDQNGKTCAEVITDNKWANCTCLVDFELTESIPSNVYMYYGLSNYYQNHRRYVKSRDDYQLLGRLEPGPSSDCDPYREIGGKPIAPCGAIANSLFSDVLTIKYRGQGSDAVSVPLLRTGIAWPSDKNIKFRNPPGDLKKAFEHYAKPPYWRKDITELDPENEDNNGFQNEDLIVWMRTAALPSFRKLYRRIDHSGNDTKYFSDGLPSGNYTLTIDYSYSVLEFNGSKRMILSNTSFLGGKNPFLGISYIVVGCLCLGLGVILLLVHVKCGKSTTEMINVTPRTPY